VRDGFLDSPYAPLTDFWLMLGDNAYESGTDEEYQSAVFDKYYTILPNLPVWSTIGNHDAGLPDQFGRFPYLNIFNLPVNGEAGGIASGTERYYSFDYANIHFVCLDSQTSDRSPAGAMLNWLREDLAATDKDWIVAYWHHPPYSSGTHFSDTELELIQMRERALPILESYGADLVLAGHSHVYERSYLINGHYGTTNTFQESMKLDGSLGRHDDQGPYRKPAGGLGADRGTVYVVCGCSGQGGEGNPFFYGRQPCMVRNLGGFGSMVLEFNGLRLDVKFLRPDGTLGDYFSIDKSQPTVVRPELKSVRSGTGLELSWPTSLPTYSLENIFALSSNPWQMTTNPVTRFGRRNRVSIPFAATNQFFRLRADP
jgi:acid phosphatase type 7